MSLATKKHIKLLNFYLDLLPSDYQLFDSHRLAIGFYAISGLDLLRGLEEVISLDRKKAIIEWVYSLQVYNEFDDTCGFQSATFVNTNPPSSSQYKEGNIICTLLALNILLILGDDLERVQKANIIKTLRRLQQPNGSFAATVRGTESDMRVVYCSVCISYILDDWSGINLNLIDQYILDCFSHDFGIGMEPNNEGHAGTVFCAIAILTLTNHLHVIETVKLNRLRKWLILRQIDDGFQGRPNKVTDSCYSFWAGASLQMLNIFELSDLSANLNYILSVQDEISGGFSKVRNTSTDPLHTYLALSAISLINDYETYFCMESLMPALNISQRAYNHLLSIHKTWKEQ